MEVSGDEPNVEHAEQSTAPSPGEEEACLIFDETSASS